MGPGEIAFARKAAVPAGSHQVGFQGGEARETLLISLSQDFGNMPFALARGHDPLLGLDGVLDMEISGVGGQGFPSLLSVITQKGEVGKIKGKPQLGVVEGRQEVQAMLGGLGVKALLVFNWSLKPPFAPSIKTAMRLKTSFRYREC